MGISPTMVMAAAAVASASASVYSAMNQPGAPKPQDPVKLQAAQNPNAQTVRGAVAGTGQGGGSPGIAQTFLSGTGGVNPSLLQLGGNSLLGGGSSAGSTPTVPGMG